ncbi:MAG: LamG domain-containing protein [Desulfurococcaceae archaeon]
MAKPATRVLRTGGLYFDGVDDYVNIPHSTSLYLDTITVSFWFQTIQVWSAPYWPASATLISKGTPGAKSSDWVIVGGAKSSGVNEGRVIVGVGATGGASDTVLYSQTGLNDGKFHHVAFTRTPGELVKLFIDGVLVDRVTDPGGTITNTRPIQIGGDPYLGGKYFNGIIDEVRIYNRALSADEIYEIYSKGTVIKDGLVLCLPFHEGEGNIAHDVSGYGNHGTIYGASWVVKKALRVLPKAR